VELKSTNIDKFIEHALQHGRRKVAAVPEKKAKPAKPAKPASINSSLPLLGQGYKLAQLSQLRTFFGFFALILVVKPCVLIVAL
jgi:hypothetical protein